MGVKTGTPFENSHLPLLVWFRFCWLTCLAKNGVSGRFIARYFSIRGKAAVRLSARIRKHMAWQLPSPIFAKVDGPIQIDETQLSRATPLLGSDGYFKPIVFGIIDQKKAFTRLVPNRKRVTLYPLIRDHVELGTTIHTDQLTTYRSLSLEGYDHHTVNHSSGMWKTPQGVSTHRIDLYWARLKRFIRTTHGHIHQKSIEAYLKEFEYRYFYRDNPIGMFEQLISNFPSYPRGRARTVSSHTSDFAPALQQ
ncbi:MAG TPA: IS1595 family transposase [Sphingomonadaceae bacterium]|nr:IS1595 family transposase [Sphingomonadaceae bacterium]